MEKIFSTAGLEYRVVGGLATYYYVEAAAPDAGRLTRDIDIVVRRADLEKTATAAGAFEFEHRHVAGADMLVRADEPNARRAVRMVFVDGCISEGERRRGVPLIPWPAWCA